MKFQACLLSSASVVLAVAAASPALAQDAGASASAEGEIIVTAQRRAERLQDVPLSVSAVNADTLANAGVVDTRGLTQVIPGLRMENLGIYVQPVIRGITTTQSSLQEANVATYIDGVYQMSMFSGFYDLPDIQQIEVLKGPQGTLFGRNATGGAILIHTRDPELDTATGRISLGYGRFTSVDAKGFVSVPLVQDKVALSLTGFTDYTKGYKRNLLLGGARTGAGSDDVLVRGKLRVAPTEGVNFVLSAYYALRHDNSALKLSNWNGNNSQAVWAAGAGLPIASKPWEYAEDIDTNTMTEHKGVSLRGEVEAGPGAFTSTTAYEHLRTQFVNDPDTSPRAVGAAFTQARQHSFSQELVYTTHQLGRFRGVAGLYYYGSDGTVLPNATFVAPATVSQQSWRDKVSTFAIFSELTYDFTDQLSLTAGLRYSHEKKTSYAVSVSGPATLGLPLPSDISNYLALPSYLPTTLPLLGEKSWNSATPRASLVYKVTPDANVYFTYSKGFKSGTFNSSGIQAAPVNPEKVNSYEAGFKGRFGRAFSINLAGFYYDYKDLQLLAISQVGVRTVSLLTNAATAEIYGAELSGQWNPSEAFNLSFGGTYLHAQYKSFPNAPDNVPTGVGGNTAVVIDASGNTMIRSPRFSGNISARYRVPVGEGQVDLSGNVFYSSKVYFDVRNRVNQPAYATVNAAIAWKPVKDQGLEFKIWGSNLTNKAVISSTILTSLWDGVDYNPPRTWGVELNYQW